MEQNKDRRYKASYKDNLGKIIRSLVEMYETAAIVKNAEHIVKVKDNFDVL